jgi:hypothetical protein
MCIPLLNMNERAKCAWHLPLSHVSPLLRPAVDLRQQHYYRHRRRDRARSKAKLNQSGRILAARTTFVHFSSSTPRNDAASAEFVPIIFIASALNCSLTDEFATALRHFSSYLSTIAYAVSAHFDGSGPKIFLPYEPKENPFRGCI